jgi:methionyl aminopeptidase
MVVLRSKKELEGLRRAGDLVARALILVRPQVRAGIRLIELDRIVEEFIRSEGGEPTYKGYQPSPSVPPFPLPSVPRSTTRSSTASRGRGGCEMGTSWA